MKTMFLKLAGACLTLSLAACAPGERLDEQARTLEAGKQWTRLYTKAPSKLRAELEGSGFDVTGSSHRLGFVDVLAEPGRLTALSARAERLVLGRSVLEIPRVDSRYTDPGEMSAFLDAVAAAHPAIASKVTMEQNLFEGQVLYAMKISDNVASDEDEPTYMMDCQMHAREVMTGEVCMDAIEYLTGNYGSDPQVTRWVDELEIWIVPQTNPDGIAYVHSTDDWWRKNRHTGCEVDLNRNCAWSWRQCPGSDDYCSSDVYHGTGPASEPETQALQALMAAVRPMYYINYHSYGEYILWPGGCERMDEEPLFALVGGLLNQTVASDSGQPGDWTIGAAAEVLYQAPGGADDQAYGAYGAISFTFELNSMGFQPDYGQWRDVTVQRQRAAWGFLLERTLDGPAVRGHTKNALTMAPVQATYQFADHPFGSGQLPLQTDSQGRFGRALLPDSDHLLVFTASGYLPEVRQVHVDQGPVDLEVLMTPGVNHPPTVSAGPDQAVGEGNVVTLQASGSDPDGNLLFYRWSQTAGPQVLLSDAATATPSFFAPGVSADTVLGFEVVASDGEFDSAPDTVNVTILDLCNSSTAHPATDTPIAIPDNDPAGIVSTITVSGDQPIMGLSVSVDITHTYIGDLVITLTSPSGTAVTLHDREGGSSQDLHAVYQPAQFLGEPQAGAWKLAVYDLAGADTGTLDAWVLTIDDACQPGCSVAGDCQLANVDQAACVDGSCQIVACSAGFADCDNLPANGCEVDLQSDAAHCGSCGTACQLDHAQPACQSGSCVVAACLGDWLDCNGLPADGCEIDSAGDPQNCGSCGSACQLDHAQATCQSGSCVVAACLDGWGDCNGLPADGCERDLSADSLNCGACGAACQPAHASGSCQGGQCLIDSCASGYADCDASVTNGCEADTEGDPANCGSCGTACSFPNAGAACQAAACVMLDCLEGFADCNSSSTDGCEVELASDPAHCGACNAACQLDHASSTCSAGECVITACEQGFADCNGQPTDGCETALGGDVLNCGACNNVCSADHGTPACENGSCVVAACDTGYADCNGQPEDGCESAVANDAENCGACGVSCAFANAGAACQAGACVMLDCRAGFADCNGSSADGCEVEPASDPANCGACGQACSLAHATAACRQGQCRVGACEPGFADCNNLPADGCETDTTGDPENCGACAARCLLAHGQGGCQQGECVLESCEENFADCNEQPGDGCETFLPEDDHHCGACGNDCHGANVAQADCNQGACRILDCAAGFADCNGDSADGCEAALAADPKNCGACGTTCQYPNAAALCQQGQCVPGDCQAGFADCNADAADGCETDVTSDAANCGSCGLACDTDQQCQDGNCRHSCPDADGDGHTSAACGGDDCDDGDARIHPGAEEICNVKDDDCNGQADEGIDCPGGGCGCAAGGAGARAGLPGLVLLAWLWRRRKR